MSKKLKQNMLLVTYAILLFLAVYNWNTVSGVIGMLLQLVMPFFCGFVIAYLVNGPYLFFQNKVYARLAGKNEKRRKLVHILSMLSAYLVIALVITVIFWIIIPQLILSVNQLGENISGYMESLKVFLDDTIAKWGLSETVATEAQKLWDGLTKNSDQIGQIINTVSPHLISFTKGLTTGIYNWIIGIIVSVYMISGKEKLIRQFKKLVTALVPERYLDRVMEVGHISNDMFGKFIIGRIIDSAIILVLCFIGMSIFQMPYALLISVIVGVTNVIPIFGPFIGGIPSAFILLVVDPIKGLWFILFIIVLQQIDGNIIGPKVVGNSIGLSGIWVMFGVIVGGGLFGVLGMLIGVPILAVVYIVGGELVNRRLKKKKQETLLEEISEEELHD